MNKKYFEIAPYVISDSVFHTVKLVKKTAKFSIKTILTLILVACSIVGVDYSLHSEIYKNNNISLFNILKNHDQFKVESSISKIYLSNNYPTSYKNDEDIWNKNFIQSPNDENELNSSINATKNYINKQLQQNNLAYDFISSINLNKTVLSEAYDNNGEIQQLAEQIQNNLPRDYQAAKKLTEQDILSYKKVCRVGLISSFYCVYFNKFEQINNLQLVNDDLKSVVDIALYRIENAPDIRQKYLNLNPDVINSK
jgi:hypothetical protein